MDLLWGKSRGNIPTNKKYIFSKLKKFYVLSTLRCSRKMMIELDDGRGAMICRWLLSSRSKSLRISFRSRNLIPKALRLERASSRDIKVFSNDELNFNTSQFSILMTQYFKTCTPCVRINETFLSRVYKIYWAVKIFGYLLTVNS